MDQTVCTTLIFSMVGFISTESLVDREALILDLGRDSFQLDVIVSDNGVVKRSTTVPMNVVVVDKNDNPPEFGETFYTVAVSEAAKVGFDIIALRAKDIDKVSKHRREGFWNLPNKVLSCFAGFEWRSDLQFEEYHPLAI